MDIIFMYSENSTISDPCKISDPSLSYNINLKRSDNPGIRIYVCKTEKRITLKIRTGCYLKLLMSERIKLIRSTTRKITKDQNSKNVILSTRFKNFVYTCY